MLIADPIEIMTGHSRDSPCCVTSVSLCQKYAQILMGVELNPSPMATFPPDFSKETVLGLVLFFSLETVVIASNERSENWNAKCLFFVTYSKRKGSTTISLKSLESTSKRQYEIAKLQFRFLYTGDE